MRIETPPEQTPTKLADYRPPAWLVDEMRLVFDLDDTATRVRSTISFRRGADPDPDADGGLRLDGRKLTLVSAAIDGEDVTSRVVIDREGLTLSGPLPDSFVWTCETELDPSANTELEGLYLSNAMYCTQCEAEGFRKITYYPDRPDVMSVFTVRIEADAEACPVLLSNGNPSDQGLLSNGRHFAEWHDPHPKPSYLFALVAGNLVAHEDHFTTASGAPVVLKIWVRRGDEDKCGFAMDALKRSMLWDERAYGREYDLDIFQIVAVDDFNMGAMENKGLNVFNSKYVLTSPETATDRDYELTEAIIAHEYFHNWTGNRITCRDWFQLCLKEGLTVFRDQQFSSDERSAAVHRITEVKQLRARQFREDAGPLAHPVRPEEYIEINNFYTATVYEKGAEVIRMLETLVGEENYRKALDLYFDRHDGQACTIEQFRQCFEDATGRDLAQFSRWWHEPGTPRVAIEEGWDGATYTLSLQQTTSAVGRNDLGPRVIPMATGLLAADGREILPTQVLEFTDPEQRFEFPGLSERPVLSINRNFSAPVIIEHETTDTERALLLAHDTDPFNKFEAGRRFGINVARAVMEGAGVSPAWVEALGHVLRDESLDAAFRALALDAPGEDELAADIADRGEPVDPHAIYHAVTEMRRALGAALGGPLSETYQRLASDAPYKPDASSAGRRALRNRCLAILMATGSDEAHRLAEEQADTANNMTERMAALVALTYNGAPGAMPRLAAFYDDWKANPLVVDKWLALQAGAPGPGAVDRVKALSDHAAFDWKNPNKFRSLIGTFALMNATGFHSADGSGYRFVTDWLLKLDPLNPQTTARLAGVFETWRRYDTGRQEAMRAEMERLTQTGTLSKNTREIVERILAG